MNSESAIYGNTSKKFASEYKADYLVPDSKVYRVQILLTPDDEGGYSAVALSLPGAGSCGDTKEEAIENAKEAIAGVIEEYIASDKTIPWQEASLEEIPPGSSKLWILVNA